MITRKQYMAGEATHAEYYGQFSTPQMVRVLSDQIGLDRIQNSTDEHLNDIPLKLWDSLPVDSCLAVLLCSANQSSGFSLSDKVCAYKAAARACKDGDL